MPNAPGNFRRLYTLTRRGAALLRELGVDADFWYRPYRASHFSFSYLQHHLSVTQWLVALSAFVRVYPAYQVIETRTGFSLAKQPPRLTLNDDGQETTITAIPDAYVYLEHANGDSSETQGFPLWIEVDCGTESKAKFHQLVLDRINFVRYKGYEAYFGVPSTTVIFCYLAVGATRDYRLNRLHTMRQWVAEVLAEQKLDDWASVFRFSTIDEGLYDTLMHFTDPVWTTADSDTLVPLLTM